MVALFTRDKLWNQPINGLMDKGNVVFVYMVEFYSAIKRMNYAACWKVDITGNHHVK
jgi:hypothetical protein